MDHRGRVCTNQHWKGCPAWINHEVSVTVIIYPAIQHLFIFRLFNDGAIPIKGHKETISLLKEGVYAHVTDQLTVKKVISDDFSASGVCNFYLTARPLYSMSLGMIFPVSLVVYPLFNSSIPDLHTHVSFCRKAVPIPTWSTPSCIRCTSRGCSRGKHRNDRNRGSFSAAIK